MRRNGKLGRVKPSAAMVPGTVAGVVAKHAARMPLLSGAIQRSAPWQSRNQRGDQTWIGKEKNASLFSRSDGVRSLLARAGF